MASGGVLPNLVLTLSADPTAFVRGLRTAQSEFVTSLRSMGEVARKEGSAITTSLNNIKAFEGATKSVESLKTALGPARTEAERLGNAFRKVQDELTGVTQRIDKAQDALARLRQVPVALRTDAQKNEIEALIRTIQRLTEQSGQLQGFTATLRRDHETAARSVAGLGSAMIAESRELGRLGETLRAAGVDTSRLAEEQARLWQQLTRVTEAARARQRIADARDILGIGSTNNVDREIDRIRAAYERLRVSGTMTATELSRAHTAMTREIIALRDNTGGLVSHFSLVRDELAKLAVAGAGIGAATREAIAFETAMSNVRKVTDFPTPKAFEEMKQQIVAMSREIPIASTGLAEIAAAGGQMGIAAKDMREFTELTAKMATAFTMTPNAAGEAIGKLANVFALTIPQTRLLADAINHLGNNTNAVEKEIVEVMVRTGSMAKVFGLASAETAALGATFLAMGLGPERASTAVNALVRELATAPSQTKDFQTALLGLGITGQEMADRIKAGPQKAILDLLTTISNLDEQAKMSTLVDLFGKQYADEIVMLVNNLGKYREMLGLVADNSLYAGSMQREFNEKLKTTQSHLDLAKNAVTEAGIALGNAFLPVIRLVADGVAGLGHGVAGLVSTFPALSAAAVSTIAAMAGLGAFQMLWSVLRGGVVTLGESMATLAVRAWALVAPFGQVGTGWTALGAALTSGVALLSGATGKIAGMIAPVISLNAAFALLNNTARFLLLTPLGLALTAASAAYLAFSGKAESSIQPLMDSAKAMGAAREETTKKIKALEDLKAVLATTRSGTAEHTKAEEELAKRLPTATVSVDDHGRALARVGSATKDNTEALNRYLETLKAEDGQQLALHLEAQAKAFMTARENVKTYSDDLKSRYGFSTGEAASLTQTFLLWLDRLTGSYDKTITSGAEMRRQLSETESGLKILIQNAIDAGVSVDKLGNELSRIRMDPAIKSQILTMFNALAESANQSSTGTRALNEQLGALASSMAGMVNSSLKGFEKAGEAADKQIKILGDSLKGLQGTLKKEIEETASSWKAMEAVSTGAHQENVREIENSYRILYANLEQALAGKSVTEQEHLRRSIELTKQESHVKIEESQRYVAEQKKLIDQEYAMRLQHAARIGQDVAKIDEARIQSQKKLLEQSEALYRSMIDRLIGEEQKLLDKANRLRQEGATFQESVNERIARLGEKLLTEEEIRANRIQRIDEALAKAREAYRNADYQEARKHSEKAVDLAESTASAVKRGDQVIISEHDAVVAAQNRIYEASEIYKDSIKQQETVTQDAIGEIRKQYDGLNESLKHVAKEIKDLNEALSKDHEIVLTANLDKVAEAAKQIDEMIAKLDGTVKIKADISEVIDNLLGVRDKIHQGFLEPVQEIFAKAKSVFSDFKEIFKEFDPEIRIKFDARSAESSVNALEVKFGELKSKIEQSVLPVNVTAANAVGELDKVAQKADEIRDVSVLVEADANQAIYDLDNIIKNAVWLDGREFEYTIRQNVVIQKSDGPTMDGGFDDFFQGFNKFSGGGRVPGVGDKDTVPILATPGEFVLRKWAVQRFPGLAEAINNGNIFRMRTIMDSLPRFAMGGPVVSVPRLPDLSQFAAGRLVQEGASRDVVNINLTIGDRRIDGLTGNRELVRKIQEAVLEMDRGRVDRYQFA
ncbi:MAG: phage tail tape measure protein [Magnetococcales bacterium]|nr:phage tail tape measure protein [Magnetococcales bacterium]